MDLPGVARRSLLDGALAAVLCALGLAEVLSGGAFADDVVPGPLWLDVVTVVAVTVPLAWRRRAPFVVVLTVMSLLAGRALVSEPLEIYALALAGLVAVFSAAAHAGPRDASLAALVTALSLGIQSLRGSGTEASPDGSAMILYAVVWLVGRAAGGAREREIAAVRARDEHTAAALAQERARIARELHDSVSHSLSMIAVQAGGARNVLAAEPQRAERSLAAIEGAARDGLVEMRRLLGLVGEEAQHEAPAMGLERLGALVESVRAAGVEVELVETGVRGGDGGGVGDGDGDGDGDGAGDGVGLGRQAEVAAYRVVQEALTNALNHVGPCAVRVEVEYGARHVGITVTDDGRGAEARGADRRGADASVASTGRGLIGMAERVRLLGGTVEAGPGDRGFRVQARIPT